ncbi:hypothetical protein EIP86_003025 [Pleurotus ostreatoroseus]|nr:hypothetical protein EIP86_003025 [Pleurotus ostreatoroseus]
MASTLVGNFISAVPSGFDVYCMDPQPTDSTPNIVVFSQPSGSGVLERKLSFRADSGFRESRIAANRREFGKASQQASVFYQSYDGNLFEVRIDRNGGRGLVNVDNVPTNTSRNATAPAMGTSLATILTGEDSKTVFLFYQADDNEDKREVVNYSADYVWQRAFGQWSLPALVTSQPTNEATTLSAFSWTGHVWHKETKDSGAWK